MDGTEEKKKGGTQAKFPSCFVVFGTVRMVVKKKKT